MHPSMMAWWSRARRERGGEECGARAGCGPAAFRGSGSRRGRQFSYAGPAADGGHFGVRRPLRFLSHKLDLDDKQVAKLAKIIDELKTERAQAAVDDRRTTAAFADAVAGSEFDAEKARQAAAQRVESAQRLKDSVVDALEKIHAELDDDQRETLSYLIRTGAITI